MPWERSNEDIRPSTLVPDSPTHKSRHHVRMWGDAESWRRMVESYFGFVAGFGFCTVDVDDSSVWARWVQYRSETAGIRIVDSNEFLRCEVELIRLGKR